MPTAWKEGADLIDDAGTLADQSLAHVMECLQIQLIGSLRRHELYRWPLHRLSDRLCVAEVVLLPLRIRTHVLRWHQPGIVTEPMELAAKMMRPDTSLHANQAWRHVRTSCFHLATRPHLTQHDRAAHIKAYNVERVLTDIDANYGDGGVDCLRHGVLLVFGAPCQL